MSALKFQSTLTEIELRMAELAPYRTPALFKEFLVKGYTAIRLSSVPTSRCSDLLRANLCLGTLITLYDDFADRPTQSDPKLLTVLYKLRFGSQPHVKILNPRNHQAQVFARSLFAEMDSVLSELPNYRNFIGILDFDLEQFYSANQFSSLVTAHPYLANPRENRMYAHHNMGMVMAAMMDLMAIERIELSEFGAMREVFVMGQRLGRIFNVLATRERELLDGDRTGELATCRSDQETGLAVQALRKEIAGLRAGIMRFDSRITTFSVRSYVDGLVALQTLHEKMEGTL